MALVDRGANGGLMGSEGRLVQWTDRTIDCTGIDSHEIRDLKIGHFGATVKTQSGPIIIEMHEYAYVQGGKTIHSSGQIEHNKNTVNDKAAAITGETPHIRTLEGYMIPMKVINGLTYIEMRPYTDQEWKTLPHVNLTGVGEWDPSVLDAGIPSDWYAKQPRTSEYTQEMPFTETGRVKPDDDESDDEEPPALDDADSSDEEEDDDDDSEVPEMKVRDEAILSDDESEGDYDDVTEGKPVSRRTVEVHLHEIIRDEMIGEYHAFEVNHGHWETIEPQFMNAYEVNAKSRRVRRKTPTNEACDTMASSTRKVREGTNIMKKFKEGWFKGTVMELPKGKRDYYMIFYEDGDKETMTERQLQKTIKIMEEQNGTFPDRWKPKSPTPTKPKPAPRSKKKTKVPESTDRTTGQTKEQENTEPEVSDNETSDKVEPSLDYNNPAKKYDDTYRLPTHTRVKAKKWDLEDCKRFFPGTSEKVIQKTFENTTQYGTSALGSPMYLRNHIKSLNPALNVPRRNEPVATDTLFASVPAVDDGSQAAQYFAGRLSFVQSAHGCGKSLKKFASILMDEIRKYGAMDILISDSAKLEISERVNDILRTMVIQKWQSEPYNKNQNFAERKWRDTKGHTNVLIQTSGATPDCWLLALKYVIFVMNHTALERLGWRTPIEWLLGYTPDITRLLKFEFYEPVYYPANEPSFPEDNTELLGRFVGISESVGHKMTYLILTENKKVISRSIARTAREPSAYTNKKALDRATKLRPAEPKNYVFSKPSSSQVGEVETVTDENEDTPNREVNNGEFEVEEMFADSASKAEKQEFVRAMHEDIGKEMETIDVSALLGRTFINDPDFDGEQVRAKILDVEPTDRTTADGTEPLMRFRCQVGDRAFEELMTYNKMLEWCDRDLDKCDMYKFEEIIGHRYNRSKREWQVKVRWAAGTVTWSPLIDIFNSDSITVSLYAEKNGLLNRDGWKRCRRFVRNKKLLARMANQAKLKNFRLRPRFKYGYQVPRNHTEAMWIDEKEGNAKWRDSEELEIGQLKEYESFKSLGKGAILPDGYTIIPCHFVYDIKHDGRHKARFVAGGHRTETPIDSTYSGVVSLPGIRLVTFLAELNDLELWGTDIGNAYLESYTSEKVAFIAGPEFGELEGHLMIIIKAQYGLKSSRQ